jgi:sulfonate transport system substrate-binding protein
VLVFAKDIHQPNAFVIVRADFVERYPSVVTRLNDVFAAEGIWGQRAS